MKGKKISVNYVDLRVKPKKPLEKHVDSEDESNLMYVEKNVLSSEAQSYHIRSNYQKKTLCLVSLC